MEVKFECSQEDLVGADLAGLGEDPKIKAWRIAVVLLPIVLMTVIALVYRHLFLLRSPNTTLLPIVLIGFAALYLWAVRSNRHHRARASVAAQLKRTDGSLFGPYYLEAQEEGLQVTHNGTHFWEWSQIKNILANSDYCRIDIPGQQSVVIGASKVGSREFFGLFVRYCNTLHVYGQRGILKEPVELVPTADIWDTAYSRPLQAEQELKLVNDKSA